MNGECHAGGIDIELRVQTVSFSPGCRDGGRIRGRGPHYYTHALPRPGIASRQTVDAEHIVLALYDDLATNDSTRLGVATDLQQEVMLGFVSLVPVLNRCLHSCWNNRDIEFAIVSQSVPKYPER